MPNKPKRPCRYPMCPLLIDSKDGYCDAHRKKVSQNYEKGRETSVKRGYDTRHQRWRKMVLARQPLCQSCKKAESTRAHHIDKNAENRSLDNGMGLCESCHNSLHVEQGDRW